MKTALVFLADGFEEIEAFTVVDVLRRASINALMVSVTPDEIVRGAHDISVLVDTNIANVDFDKAELMVLPGGMPGAETLRTCEPLTKALKAHVEAGKTAAAICAAPIVLGSIGALNGKKATCYSGFDAYLEGAIMTTNAVEVDGNIITANSPSAAMAFSLAIVEKLRGAEKVAELKEVMVVR